jgi:hypothetical protein
MTFIPAGEQAAGTAVKGMVGGQQRALGGQFLNQRGGKAQDTGQPGGGFWGCAPNVPPRPAREPDRDAEWIRIVKDVLAYNWPPTLP